MLQRYIFVIVGFLIDGIISAIFPINFMNNSMYFVPCFGFCALILNARKIDFTDSIIMAILMGMYYDFIYTDTFLMYSIIFLICIVLINIWNKHLGDSLVETIILCVAGIFSKELLAFIFLKATGGTLIDVYNFLVMRMFLTLLINVLFVCFLHFFDEIKEQVINQREARIRSEEKISLIKLKR